MLAPLLISRVICKSFIPSLLLLSAPLALAAPVSFVESLQDEAPGLTNLHCTYAAVNSPDDKFSYSSSFCDDAINSFSRDPVTGKMTLLSSLVGNETTGEGLRSVKWLAMHPNGKYLFAHGYTGLASSNTVPYHQAIYIYERDTATGALTFKAEFKDPLINDAWNMHISDDGHFLYVGRQAGIEVIQIASNGVLTHTQSLHKTSNLGSSSYTRSFVFSPDNKYAFVDSGTNSISWLLRDPVSGSLSFAGELLSPGMVASSGGSLRVKSIGRSSDGKHLYAFVERNDTNQVVLRHFSIAADGALTYVDDVTSTPASPGEKFYCPSEILISPNDKLLYFIDGCADNFQVWLRNTATGSLNFIGYVEEDDGKDNIPRSAFSQENNISFSKDGHFAIAAVNAGITTINLTADVALTGNFPSTVVTNANYTGVITLTNTGPADAHDIELVITGNALAGLQSAGVSVPQGSCNQNAGTLVCTLPALANKAVETIELKLQASTGLDPLQINVTKTQAEIDPDTQSDSLAISVQPVAPVTSSSSSSSSAPGSSSSLSSSSASAQSSSAPATGSNPPPSSGSSSGGGGSMGFVWLLLLSLFSVAGRYQKQ